jgi:hypothetical protein
MKRSFTAGSATMRCSAALTRSIATRGVPAGKTKPCQEETTKSAKPASAMVGTSGMVGQRVAEVTASARIRPS